MSETYDVVINGGGPVGMGLAIELGQRGVKTCVIERYAEPQPIPKGQNLTQRTAEHFRAWGCEAELRKAHPLPKDAGIGGMTSYGTLLSDYNYDWLNRSNVKDYYFAANARLPQYATERVLRERVKAIPYITVRYGWSGEGLAVGSDGCRLDIAAREGGQTDSIEARYIVGCDGARSVVRAAGGIGEQQTDHNRLMALLVFRSEELHELLKRYPGKAFYNVLHPDYEGYWLFFGRVDHGHSWFFHAPVPLGTTERNFDFRSFLHRAVGQVFELDLDHVGFWDLRVSIADSYRNGRVFLAGDAAHSHPPYGGYGINTGFEDARNLGWKLAARLQGWGSEALLDSYSAERRPVFVSTARDFIERFIEEDRAFLDAYAPDTGRQAFENAWYARNLDAAEVQSFEPNYEGSPIVPGTSGTPTAKGSHSFKARAGHHLPPPGPEGKVAAEALSSGFTILAADPHLAAPFQTAAQHFGVPLEVSESQPQWHATWEHPVVLVRPDGFVAWAGDEADTEVAARIIEVATGR